MVSKTQSHEMPAEAAREGDGPPESFVQLELPRSHGEDLSNVLVFGIAGRVGSGASFVRDKIVQSLKTFDYEVDIVDVTEMIEQLKPSLGDALNDKINARTLAIEELKGHSKATRVKSLQLTGNALRRKHGNAILSKCVINYFISPDLEQEGFNLNRRKAYVIDSLKHPAEVELFREVFGVLFWMVGVVSSDSVRFNRLRQNKEFERRAFEYISTEDTIGRDEEDKEGKFKSGQAAIKTVVEADYFFANDSDTKDGIEAEAARLTKLVFGIQVVSPTPEEVGMNAAYQASLRAACLSRQVGAAIVGSNGQILSIGYNDVPKFGGGLYASTSNAIDHRCWAWGAKCYNDEEKQKITRQVVGVLREEGFIAAGKEEAAVKALRDSRISGLIEFSRAVHAEMEALLSIARLGISGLVGSTLYTTTYPCHNCAKHIVDAGLSRVVYMEPYEKSLARELHSDAIRDPLESTATDKVSFDNYGGLAPKRFSCVFKPSKDRKVDGRFRDTDRFRHGLQPVEREGAESLKRRISELCKSVDEIKDFLKMNGESADTGKSSQSG